MIPSENALKTDVQVWLENEACISQLFTTKFSPKEAKCLYGFEVENRDEKLI